METLIEVPIKTAKQAIEEAQEKYLQDKIYRSRWKSIRASGIGDKCTRRIYYYLTCGELADEMTTDLVSIFEEGKDQEPGVRRFLSELGFEVMKAGFTESWEKFNISGSVDGVLTYGGEQFIVEIKTVSDFAWDKLYEPKDFDEGYYKKWFAQMQIYLLLFGYKRGIFVLKRKQAKQLRVVEFEIDYDYAEALLKKAEVVNESVKTGVPPEFLSCNPVECKRCPFFGKVCNPPLDFGEGTANIEDPELEKKMARREEIKPVATEYEHLDKELKERLREIPAAICGDFAITGKEGVRKYAASEAKVVKTWSVKIERINSTGVTA